MDVTDHLDDYEPSSQVGCTTRPGDAVLLDRDVALYGAIWLPANRLWDDCDIQRIFIQAIQKME